MQTKKVAMGKYITFELIESVIRNGGDVIDIGLKSLHEFAKQKEEDGFPVEIDVFKDPKDERINIVVYSREKVDG